MGTDSRSWKHKSVCVIPKESKLHGSLVFLLSSHKSQCKVCVPCDGRSREGRPSLTPPSAAAVAGPRRENSMVIGRPRGAERGSRAVSVGMAGGGPPRGFKGRGWPSRARSASPSRARVSTIPHRARLTSPRFLSSFIHFPRSIAIVQENENHALVNQSKVAGLEVWSRIAVDQSHGIFAIKQVVMYSLKMHYFF